MHTVLGFVAALAMGSSAPVAPTGLDAIFAGMKPDAPGCAVGVRRGDDPVLLKAYGLADLERPAPITPQTVFDAGSVSKQFTTAAILALVADGKLALRDDVRKYVPELPDYGATITVDNLLTHTSGLRDWYGVESLSGWPTDERVSTVEDTLQVVTRQRALNHAPGAAFSYTNAGYLLAAIIVQRVSGKSLADFTRERFFTPLGMTHSQWRDDFQRIIPNRAVAYSQSDEGAYGATMPTENVYGQGGLMTTVGDLLIWNDALSSGRLGPVITAGLAQPVILSDGRKVSYGKGLAVTTHNGEPELSHTGADGGYRAWLARYPRQRLSVAILCNDGEVEPDDLGYAIADLYIPAPASRSGAKPATSAAELAKRPGLYVSEQKGYVDYVVAKDGALREGPSQPPFEPDGVDRYRVGDVLFQFRGETLERLMPDGDLTLYRRVQPETPTPADLEAVAGRYASEEVGATLKVTLEDGQLAVTPVDRPSARYLLKPLYHDAFLGSGSLVRLVRDSNGKVEGLRFTRARVFDLVFARMR